MQIKSHRAVLVLGLGGIAGLAAVRRRRGRSALSAEEGGLSPTDPPDTHLSEDRMDILASAEGMPEVG